MGGGGGVEGRNEGRKEGPNAENYVAPLFGDNKINATLYRNHNDNRYIYFVYHLRHFKPIAVRN